MQIIHPFNLHHHRNLHHRPRLLVHRAAFHSQGLILGFTFVEVILAS